VRFRTCFAVERPVLRKPLQNHSNIQRAEYRRQTILQEGMNPSNNTLIREQLFRIDIHGRKKQISNQETRTVEEINEKIRKGDAQVLTAEEMKRLVESSGVEVALKEVDVVTTGTFGAMCSSGAIINVGHSDPPIKIDKAWINNVPI
jgi:hypothetical protein